VHRSLFLELFAASSFLILATATAVGIHIAAMFLPGPNETLGFHAVSRIKWWPPPILAPAILATVEIDEALAAGPPVWIQA
jgi:hypothetical protein